MECHDDDDVAACWYFSSPSDANEMPKKCVENDLCVQHIIKRRNIFETFHADILRRLIIITLRQQ